MLDWDDPRTFLVIARHGTLSGAARAIKLRQSTMGRRLEALEQRAGAVLLRKTPSGYVLTEAGAAVLGNVERIEAETLTVERLTAGKDVRLDGTARLTTVETLAAEILSPVLASVRDENPAVRIEVVAATRTLSLTRREADVAPRLARFTQADIVVRKVGEVAFGLYAAPAYLARAAMPDWSGGAAGHAVILTEPDLLETPAMAWLRGFSRNATVALASNSRLIHRAAARDGIGIVCFARYLGDGAAGLVRVDAPKVAPPTPVRDLWLGVHCDMRHTLRIRAFTDALQDGLRRGARRLRPPD